MGKRIYMVCKILAALITVMLIVASCFKPERRPYQSVKLNNYLQTTAKVIMCYPVQCLESAIRLNEYLQASEEEKKSPDYAGFKELLVNVGDSISWKGVGIFYPGGSDLMQKGAEWIVRCNGKNYLTLSKPSDTNLWKAVCSGNGFSYINDKISFETMLTLAGDVFSPLFMNNWKVATDAVTEGYSGVGAYIKGNVDFSWDYTLNTDSDTFTRKRLVLNGNISMVTKNEKSEKMDEVKMILNKSSVPADFKYDGEIGWSRDYYSY